MKPNFENYSILQLNESLRTIQADEHPENFKIIKEQIELRKETGFNLAGEMNNRSMDEVDLTLQDIAFPIWWSYTWRTVLITSVFSLIVFAIIGLIATVLGLTKYIIIPLIIFHLISIPIIGIFCMRLVLVGKYKNFFITVTPKMANKAIKKDV